MERMIKDKYAKGVKVALVDGVLKAVRGQPMLRVMELEGIINIAGRNTGSAGNPTLIHPDATLLKPLFELTDAAL